MELTEIARSVLTDHGWHENRNVLDRLVLDTRDELFPAAEKLVAEFGLLEIGFRGPQKVEPMEVLYFDVDESEEAKILRARTFGYKHYNDISLKKEPDFNPSKNRKLQSIVAQKLGMPSFYIGFHEEYLGFDIFVVPSGEIYICHYQDPTKAAESFYEYLNKHIQGVNHREKT